MKINIHKFSIIIFCIFIVLLPIDAALGNLVGNISLINYVGLLYILLRIISIVIIEKKIVLENIKKNKQLILFVIYFAFMAFFKEGNEFNLFFYESFLMSFGISFLAICEQYNKEDIKLIKKSIIYGFYSILFAYLFFSTTENGRLVFNERRSMDPNFFACGMCLTVAVLFNKIFVSKNKLKYIIMTTFLLLVIVLTGSRSGLIANLFVMIILFFQNSNISKLKKFLYVIVFVLIVFFISSNIDSFIPKNILDRFTISYIQADSGAGRFLIWRNGIDYWKNNNIIREIFGTGPGTFQYLVLSGKHASHNIYLQVLVEEGIVGLLLFLISIINMCRINFNNKNYIMFSVFIGVLIGGLGIDINTTRFFWVCIFLSLCNFNISEKGDNYEEN